MHVAQALMDLPQSRLAIAVALTCLVAAQPAAAAYLNPGESATVSPGQVPESWFLEREGTLTVQPGARTGQIFAAVDSHVGVDGATVQSNNRQPAIGLVNSSAKIHNSTLTSDTLGMSVSSTWLEDGARSSAILDNSVVRGGHTGLEIDSGTVEARRTAISGSEVGIEMSDGSLALRDGSDVSGNVGIILQSAYFFADELTNQVLLENSTVSGTDGSAIEIRAKNPTDDFGNPTVADIVVRNSQLNASNGILVDAHADANVGLTLDDSHLTGQFVNVDRLQLANHASWTLTADNQVGDLRLDRSRIDLGGSMGDFHVLEVDSLTGQGQFDMVTDLAGGQGDLLKVHGQAQGSFELKIANTGREPAASAAAQTVVQTGGGDAQFAVVGGQVEAGAFAYDLQRQGDDWALVQKTGSQGKALLSSSARSVLGLYNAAPVVWQGEAAGLRSRLDELRGGQAQGGLWIRSQAGRYQIDGAHDLRYQLNQAGVTLGADARLNDELSVGLIVGTSRSDLDFSGGTQGTIDSVYLGTYANWTDADGYYVDALIKANRFSNRSQVMMSDGVKARGSYRDYALGGSLEMGRRLALDDGWYLKPYGQLSALSVQGQDYQLDNGLQASNNAATSLTGKLGSQFGRRLEMAGGGSLQPYAKIAVYREFADRNQARINGHTFDNSLAGRGAELGVGFSAQLTQAFQLNADFDYATGQRVSQDYGISAGLRYAF
jgi:outer membrane autotransporter protein